MGAVLLQVATAVLHMDRIDAAAAANTAAGGWGIPGRAGEGVREELELSEEALDQLAEQLDALEKRHKAQLAEFTALLPAQVGVGREGGCWDKACRADGAVHQQLGMCGWVVMLGEFVGVRWRWCTQQHGRIELGDVFAALPRHASHATE
jgi:hypothetical protein